MQLYDTIGRGYGRHRRPDPRIAAQILQALEGASSVVNVGAGAGWYEPRDRKLVAVEPSAFAVIDVPIPHDCTDGFLGAYWRRPHSYLDLEIRSAISFFSRLTNVEDALAALQRDLASGDWHRRYGEILQRSTIDLGYRLIVA